MPDVVAFDPSFRLLVDFSDCDFSLLEADPDYVVGRMSALGVEYVLVQQDEERLGGYPESRWRIVDGVVTEMSISWDTAFSEVDGIKVDAAKEFVSEWNAAFGEQLCVKQGNQIWDKNNTIALVKGMWSSRKDQWRLLTYFNPDLESHRCESSFFCLGAFDAPQVVERFLDDCLWTDLRNEWSSDLGFWLYLWPGIQDRWPDLDSNPASWLEALDAVMGFVFDDGRFEVYYLENDESITTLDRFMHVTQPYRDIGDIDAIKMFFFISPEALQLRP